MSNIQRECDLCQEGTLEEQKGFNTVTYKGIKKQIPSYSCVCDVCEVESVLPSQLRQNKREMIAFKKEVDGLLSGNEVRQIREHLAVSQAQAAKIFGGGTVAFSKYESDDVMQSEAMDNLLRVAAHYPNAFSFLVRKAGIQANVVSPISKPIWSSLNVSETFSKVISGGLTPNQCTVLKRTTRTVNTFNESRWESCLEC